MREAIPFDELEKRLVNLYIRHNKHRPDEHFIDNLKPYQKIPLHMSITLPEGFYLPGIKIRNNNILVRDFERKILKDTGWKVIRAIYSQIWHPGGIYIVLSGIKSLKS